MDRPMPGIVRGNGWQQGLGPTAPDCESPFALLPQVKLLTPFQAENDHHIKDTYNYATVQVSNPLVIAYATAGR